MKKIIFLLIFVSIFFAPLFSFARIADPARLPKNEPLLTPPKNTQPNFSGNVNSGLEVNVLVNGQQLEDGKEVLNTRDVLSDESNKNKDDESTEVSGKKNNFMRIALILVFALVLVYAIRKTFIKSTSDQ